MVNGLILTGENSDGTLYRAVFDGSLDTYDLTENIQGNSTSSVTWTPQEAGIYYYTCDVSGHAQMFGKIVVLTTPEVSEVSASASLLQLGVTNAVSNTLVYVESCADLGDESAFERTHVYVPSTLSTNLTIAIDAQQAFFRLVSEEY